MIAAGNGTQLRRGMPRRSNQELIRHPMWHSVIRLAVGLPPSSPLLWRTRLRDLVFDWLDRPEPREQCAEIGVRQCRDGRHRHRWEQRTTDTEMLPGAHRLDELVRSPRAQARPLVRGQIRRIAHSPRPRPGGKEPVAVIGLARSTQCSSKHAPKADGRTCLEADAAARGRSRLPFDHLTSAQDQLSRAAPPIPLPEGSVEGAGEGDGVASGRRGDPIEQFARLNGEAISPRP